MFPGEKAGRPCHRQVGVQAAGPAQALQDSSSLAGAAQSRPCLAPGSDAVGRWKDGQTR